MEAKKVDSIVPAVVKADAVEVKPEIVPEVKPEVGAIIEGEKIGELLKEKPKEEPTIRESEFLELKNENKGLFKEIKKMQEMIVNGLSKKEVSETLKKIGDKYNVDPNFLDEVSKAIKAEADEEKVITKAKPVDEKEKSEKSTSETDRIDKIFKEQYAKTLEAMPEFKDIADADVIKSLTLDPTNSHKTFAQVLEKAYGHLVKGKGKTLDSAQPGGRKENTEIDFNKASKDPDYFKSLMADPASRREYNSNLAKRLKL